MQLTPPCHSSRRQAVVCRTPVWTVPKMGTGRQRSDIHLDELTKERVRNLSIAQSGRALGNKKGSDDSSSLPSVDWMIHLERSTLSDEGIGFKTGKGSVRFKEALLFAVRWDDPASENRLRLGHHFVDDFLATLDLGDRSAPLAGG
jgi:hypothetical protein